jgi:hypothetical protein
MTDFTDKAKNLQQKIEEKDKKLKSSEKEFNKALKELKDEV